jgi:hypothetical protein
VHLKHYEDIAQKSAMTPQMLIIGIPVIQLEMTETLLNISGQTVFNPGNCAIANK